jgi:hypothetical protein
MIKSESGSVLSPADSKRRHFMSNPCPVLNGQLTPTTIRQKN